MVGIHDEESVCTAFSLQNTITPPKECRSRNKPIWKPCTQLYTVVSNLLLAAIEYTKLTRRATDSSTENIKKT